MDQLKKKNLGIPTKILTVMAYVIGYGITKDYGILLAAVLFAVLVFTLNFEDKVKDSVKQSYIISLVFSIGYLGFDFIYQLSELFNPISIDYYTAHNLFSYLYKYGIGIYHIAVIAVFVALAVAALQDKKLEIEVVSDLLDEEKPKTAKKKRKPVNWPKKSDVNNTASQKPEADQTDTQQEMMQKPETSQQNSQSEKMQSPEAVQLDTRPEEMQPSETVQLDTRSEEMQSPEAGQQNSQLEEKQKSETMQPDTQPEEFQEQNGDGIADMEWENYEKSKGSENLLGPTCPICGMMNRLEAVFCSACGTKLR